MPSNGGGFVGSGRLSYLHTNDLGAVHESAPVDGAVDQLPSLKIKFYSLVTIIFLNFLKTYVLVHKDTSTSCIHMILVRLINSPICVINWPPIYPSKRNIPCHTGLKFK